MNTDNKARIKRLRLDGVSYNKIAAELSMSINTVKSFCRRENLQGKPDTSQFCPQCGKLLKRKPKCKPKRFCSDKCRLAWWNMHRDMVNKKALYPFICACCGKEFLCYGNRTRKYCSHECYISDRFGNRELRFGGE